MVETTQKTYKCAKKKKVNYICVSGIARGSAENIDVRYCSSKVSLGRHGTGAWCTRVHITRKQIGLSQTPRQQLYYSIYIYTVADGETNFPDCKKLAGLARLPFVWCSVRCGSVSCRSPPSLWGRRREGKRTGSTIL